MATYTGVQFFRGHGVDLLHGYEQKSKINLWNNFARWSEKYNIIF